MADLSIDRVTADRGALGGAYAPRLETVCATVGGGVRRKFLVFDKVTPLSATDTSHAIEFAFDLVLPTTYTSTTGLKFLFKWAVDGLSTGNVLWGIKAELIVASTTVEYTDTFGTVTTQATAVPTVANTYTTTTISVVKARLGTPAAGDMVRVVLYRDATSASDTTSAIAKMVPVIDIVDY